MHLGHAWVAMHNHAIAKGSGGRFVLIADDVMYYLPQLQIQSWPLVVGVERYVEDLTWLGLAPDEVVYSTRNAEAHAEAAERLGIARPGRLAKTWQGTCVPDVKGVGASAQYDPWLVLVRVVDDYLAGVNAFYRGDDLREEMYLYDDTCRRLGYRPCGQEYLPVVRREGVAKKESKSAGAVSIRDLRAAGYEPWQLLGTLREAHRRAAKAGLRDVVIPEGVLQKEPLRWLEHSTYSTDEELDNADLAGRPWQDDVIEYHRRMRDQERRAHHQHCSARRR